VPEQAWLIILTAAIGLLGAILGLFARMVLARIEKPWETISRHSKEIAALQAFEARFNATESAWDLWREGLERRLESLSAEMRDLEIRLTRLERNGNH
jgi:hypothetical protein